MEEELEYFFEMFDSNRPLLERDTKPGVRSVVEQEGCLWDEDTGQPLRFILPGTINTPHVFEVQSTVSFYDDHVGTLHQPA